VQDDVFEPWQLGDPAGRHQARDDEVRGAHRGEVDLFGRNGQLGKLGARRLELLAQQRCEAIVHRLAPGQRGGAGRRHLDEERLRERRFGGERLEVRAGARPGPGKQVPALGCGASHGVEQQFDARVVGGEKTGFLVAEVLVEGLARHARAGDHVGDRRRRVPPLGDDLGHGFEHPPALGGQNDLAGQLMGPPR